MSHCWTPSRCNYTDYPVSGVGWGSLLACAATAAVNWLSSGQSVSVTPGSQPPVVIHAQSTPVCLLELAYLWKHPARNSVLLFIFSRQKDVAQIPFTLEMRPAYGEKCFTRPAIHVWCKKFACGRESVVDEIIIIIIIIRFVKLQNVKRLPWR